MIKDHQNFQALSAPAKRLYDFYAGYCDENSVIRMPLEDNLSFQELLEQSFVIRVDDKYILINNYYIYLYILSLQALLNNKNININNSYGEFSLSKERERKKGFPSRFVPPTLEELDAYIKDNKLNVSADKFYDYYQACGWTVGRGKPMKDWKAALRNWSRRQAEFSKPSKPVRMSGPTHDEGWSEEFFQAALARQRRESEEWKKK